MKPFDFEAKCQLPGPAGALWRLVKVWDPDAIDAWIKGEMLRGTPPRVLAGCIADVMAGAAYVFAQHVAEKHEAMLGDNGILGLFRESAEIKLRQLQGGPPVPGGILGRH